jgi:hypothetical protein
MFLSNGYCCWSICHEDLLAILLRLCPHTELVQSLGFGKNKKRLQRFLATRSSVPASPYWSCLAIVPLTRAIRMIGENGVERLTSAIGAKELENLEWTPRRAPSSRLR